MVSNGNIDWKFNVYSLLSENKSNSTPELLEIPVREALTPTLIYLTIVAIVVGIAVPLVIYIIQQWSEKRGRISRSCDAIIKEIRQNKLVTTGTKYDRIKYRVYDQSHNLIAEVDYVNAFLETDAYQSVLNSGLFTHFCVDTQNSLTSLYARIKSRNELITYMDKYEDLFFLYNAATGQSLDRWYASIEKYDVLMTDWEKEILEWVDEVEDLLIKEKPKTIGSKAPY